MSVPMTHATTDVREPDRADAGSMAAIELVDLAKDYAGEVQAVRQVDLAIESGEFFSLLGPSGCGKTTTLRMIAGFEEPTRGQILLYGKDMVGVPPYRRDVNMVFQSYALFPHMNVYDNIAFGLRRQKYPKTEIAHRVTEMMELVDLAGKGHRRPAELSGGQQQRVALARALVNRPRALLLDEPLAALDLKLRQSMQSELKRIQQEVGITFVFVTHDQNEALTLSDRLVVMNEGRVEQLGTPHELYERPATRFVAGFIGTSNIIDGTVDRTVGGVAVLDLGPDERLLVPDPSLQAGQHVELTVRPEKIVVHAESDQPAANMCAMRGTVTEVVYLGTSTNYTVRTSTGGDVVVFQQNASSATATANQGDRVWVSWSPEHSYLLQDPAGSPSEPAPAPPIN
jgi:spermidine/putrescine transport system ATP-binding protein